MTFQSIHVLYAIFFLLLTARLRAFAFDSHSSTKSASRQYTFSGVSRSGSSLLIIQILTSPSWRAIKLHDWSSDNNFYMCPLQISTQYKHQHINGYFPRSLVVVNRRCSGDGRGLDAIISGIHGQFHRSIIFRTGAATTRVARRLSFIGSEIHRQVQTRSSPAHT